MQNITNLEDSAETVESLLLRPDKPQYIREQHNNDCQQYFAPISHCIFAMPGANITIQTVSPPQIDCMQKDKRRQLTPRTTKTDGTDQAPKRELMTFCKNGIIDGHLRLLLASMMENRWLDRRTSETDFLELFSGQRSECRIIWSGIYGKGTLVMLFCQLLAEKLVTLANGFRLSKVLEGHFVDSSGKFLTRLSHGDPCAQKALPEIKGFIKILKTRIGCHPDSQDCPNVRYTDSYDSFDHQDLHLHRKH